MLYSVSLSLQPHFKTLSLSEYLKKRAMMTLSLSLSILGLPKRCTCRNSMLCVSCIPRTSSRKSLNTALVSSVGALSCISPCVFLSGIPSNFKLSR